MPTPPPGWSDTQVAPLAVLRRALSSGQSETASDPSRIASVSRLGLATEPESRWSRPITTGALSSPDATLPLYARPSPWPSPSPPPHIRADRHWNRHLARANSGPFIQDARRFWDEGSGTCAVRVSP